VPLRPIRSVDVKLYVLKTTKTTKMNVQPQAVYILRYGKDRRRAELLLYMFWVWRQTKRLRTYILRIESWISITQPVAELGQIVAVTLLLFAGLHLVQAY